MGKKKGSGGGSLVSVSASWTRGTKRDWKVHDDFLQMSRKDLAKEAKSAIDAANKRLKNLRAGVAKGDILSPALESVERSGRKTFSRAGNLKQLQKEYAAAIHFLRLDTASVSGSREFTREMERKTGHKLNDAQKKIVYKLMRQLEHGTPAGMQAWGSENALQYIADEVVSRSENLDSDEIDLEALAEAIANEAQRQYEIAEEAFYNTFRDPFSF